MTLYIRVKELREARDWNQAQLAAASRVRPSTIVDMEKGRTKRVDLDVLERLAKALGVAPGYLIADTPPKRKRG